LGFSVSYSYPGYGYPIGYAYTPMAPLVMQGQPLWVGGDPSDNAVMRGALEEEARRWQQPLDATEKPKARRLPQPSTPDAKLKSLRLQLRGDAWLKEQDYTQAYQRFQQAVDAAEDRPEAHFRLGFALVALGRYELAVKNFKRGLEIDPALPLTGSNLDAIYGKENRLAISSFTHKVADWVREDIRDPDRLFLMGLLLHFDDDHDRSTPFFATAYRLAGEGSHLVAFLNPVEPEANKPAGGQVGPAPLAPGEAGLKPPAAGIPPQPAAPVIQPKIIVPPGAPNPPRLETNPQRQREAAGGPKLPPLPEP
jgi:tetratricopeptide (TPR) repeat protein